MAEAASQAGDKPKGKPRGRPFVKGHGVKSPGRPPLAAEQAYRDAVKVACPPADLEQIVRKAVAEAKAGGAIGAKAREWLSKQLGTDAPVKTDARVSMSVVDTPLPVEGDPELERLVRETAARMWGPSAPVPAAGMNGTVPHA